MSKKRMHPSAKGSSQSSEQVCKVFFICRGQHGQCREEGHLWNGCRAMRWVGWNLKGIYTRFRTLSLQL
jgi:hypothetical protein